MSVDCQLLGAMSFEAAEVLQRELADKRRLDRIPDTLLLLEHPPTYTFGKQAIEGDLLTDAAWREDRQIALLKTDRGGRLTYHGPGQIVGYLIFKLASRRESVPGLVNQIESLLISLLRHFGISGERDPDYPGVWTNDAKIAAIGLRIDRGVTRHGFSLNHSPDLSHYQGIIPCGISNRRVTSMKEILGDNTPTRAEVLSTIMKSTSSLLSRGPGN